MKIFIFLGVLAVCSLPLASGQGACVAKDRLTVSPVVVSYVGGEDVTVSGACLKSDDTIVLVIEQWKETRVTCSYVDSTSCLCRLSYLDIIGKINVRLLINDQDSLKGVLLSQSVPSTKSLTGLETYYLFSNISNDINLRWSAFAPSDVAQPGAKIELLYVWIDNSKFETRTKFIKELSADSTSTAVNLKTFDIQLLDQFDVKAIKSFIVISSKTPTSQPGRDVLKWLKIATLVVLDKMDVASQACQKWHAKEPDVDEYVNNLPACWPRVPLRADGNFVENFGDFVKDPSCNPYGGSCWYHPGAKSCFRSMKHYKGTGQQCCYGDNGLLLVGPPGGSTFDLGHSIYKNVDHFYEDVVSYFICCIHSKNCNLYYDKRPSESTNWRPDVFGGVTGDPHFITFDNVKYTFNGQGEFTLYQILDNGGQVTQTVQIRMMPLKDKSGSDTKGTVVTAIAIKNEDPKSDHVQIELRGNGKETVLLDGIEYDFDQVNLEYITVVDANVVALPGKAGYLIQLSNEINIEAQMTPDKTALLLAVKIPQSLKTRGLLGVYDGVPTNDFTLPNGTALSLDASNDKVVYTQFGTRWQATKETSIFKYFNGQDHSSFVNAAYTPAFITDGVTFADSNLQAEAASLCGNDQRCLFDVAVTGQLEVGRLTRKLEQEQAAYERLKQLNLNSCTPLSVIYENGAIVRNLLFVNDTGSAYEYKFSCDKGYCLSEKYDTVRCTLAKYDRAVPKCKLCSGSSRDAPRTFTFIGLALVALFLQIKA